MELNPSNYEATLEAIAGLVKQHVGEHAYTGFHPWGRRLPRGRRLEFLKDLARFDIQTSIRLDAARQPDEGLNAKAEQALAYYAVALWHIYELGTATQRADERG